MAEKVIKKFENPPLPDAGDERREVLRERADNLEEAAEALGDDYGAIDPSKLEIENEIAQHFNEFNELAVSDPQTGYHYSWTYRGRNGFFIKWKQARDWEVVHGAMPECMEHKAVDGTRQIGDVLLMRIRVEKHRKWQRYDEERGQAMMEASAAQLEEMARKYAGRGVTLHTNLDENNPHLKRAMDRAHQRSLATRRVDGMIRAGTVPGAPIRK